MKHILVTAIVLVSTTEGYTQTARQRIGLHGTISYGAMATPNGSSPDGARGDIVLVSVDANDREEITVAAYLNYRDAVERRDRLAVEGVGEWRGVPVNQFGAQRGYQSGKYRSAVASVRWVHRGESDSRTVQLFLPYQALDLDRGPYQVAYLFRVFVNGQMVDEFYTDETRYVMNTGSRLREIEYHCKAQMGSGPSLCPFRLLGTTDPADVWPTDNIPVQSVVE